MELVILCTVLAIQSLGLLAGLLWILWSKRDYAMIDRALIAYEQGLSLGAKFRPAEPIGIQLPPPEPPKDPGPLPRDDTVGQEEAEVLGRFDTVT